PHFLSEKYCFFGFWFFKNFSFLLKGTFSVASLRAQFMSDRTPLKDKTGAWMPNFIQSKKFVKIDKILSE
ncbi:hypothetical protein, partial [Fictibacillus gelatini]|uniref:hypothetical protein n=1 Tax=Fictibacillus gelatini TaxID=225985 RepID=UPI001B7FDC75